MRRLLLGGIGAALLASVVLLATDGPLTPLMNLRTRTNENGHLLINAGAAGVTDGPLTPMANLRGRTNESGYLRVAFAGTSQTLTGPLLLGNGTAAAPSYSFSGTPTYGIYFDPTTGVGFSHAGTAVFATRTNALGFPAASSIGWGSSAIGDAFDTVLARAAAGAFGFQDAATPTKKVTLTVPTGTGNLIPVVVASAGVSGATGVTASIATFTVGAADATFEVGCNVLVTTATTHSFSCDVTYTDESNAARTMVLPVVQLAGTFVTTGLITNVTGAGPYESPTMNIRAKAATAITVRTSAGGTYTTVVYNARGVIKQVS